MITVSFVVGERPESGPGSWQVCKSPELTLTLYHIGPDWDGDQSLVQMQTHGTDTRSSQPDSGDGASLYTISSGILLQMVQDHSSPFRLPPAFALPSTGAHTGYPLALGVDSASGSVSRTHALKCLFFQPWGWGGGWVGRNDDIWTRNRTMFPGGWGTQTGHHPNLPTSSSWWGQAVEENRRPTAPCLPGPIRGAGAGAAHPLSTLCAHPAPGTLLNVTSVPASAP